MNWQATLLYLDALCAALVRDEPVDDADARAVLRLCAALGTYAVRAELSSNAAELLHTGESHLWTAPLSLRADEGVWRLIVTDTAFWQSDSGEYELGRGALPSEALECAIETVHRHETLCALLYVKHLADCCAGNAYATPFDKAAMRAVLPR